MKEKVRKWSRKKKKKEKDRKKKRIRQINKE
jgi:hypothetical protein